jgi:glycosyltransferase involved in cell wall biosynthesis
LNFTADIIVPVWNRPVETRECLVSLMEHSPGARLIMVDSGSDRDTESLLEEFAEILGERALLLRTEVNEGFIRGVNRGLARVEAPWAVVVKSGAVVAPGWLDAILEAGNGDPAAGIVVPRVLPMVERGRRLPTASRSREISPATFDAVALRRDLLDRCGLFDEGLDGGEWSLRDYVRRAWRERFVSLHAPSSVVYRGEEIVFGSAVRREETLTRSIQAYRERWGEGREYLLFFSPGTAPGAVDGFTDLLLEGARQGDRFTLLLDRGSYRLAESGWIGSLHESIRLESLPVLFSRSGLRKRVEEWRRTHPDGIVVAAGETSEIEAELPERLSVEVTTRRREKYAETGVA